MRLKFLILIIFLGLSITPFVLAEEVKVNDAFYVSASNFDSLNTKEYRQFKRELEWEGTVLKAERKSKIIVYFLDSFNEDDMGKLAQSKFSEFKLGKEGLPVLNLLVFYSLKEKEIKIIYPATCVYDQSKLDNLAKDTASKMKESKDYSEIVTLFKSLAEISIAKFEDIKDHPVFNCPAPETSKYKVKEIKKENKNCKPLFENDKFNSSRLKIQILGNSFDNEKEFKNAIDKYVLKEGFQKIEPFKSYTKNGKDGLFHFVYGNYNIEVDFGMDEDSEDKVKAITDELSKCPNVFYTILLNDKISGNSGDPNYLRPFYRPNMKTSFNTLRGSTIMHETGHRFELDDEYPSGNAINAEMSEELGSFQLSCSRKPDEHWKQILEEFGEYRFRTCSGTDKAYRSSFQSIMRHSKVYKKFNYLSCLFLVREFEKVDLITDKKVSDVCMNLYNSGEIQQPEEIAKEDKDYEFCLLAKNMYGRDNKNYENIDCKKMLIECSKIETNNNKLKSCVRSKFDEIEKLISQYGGITN
ncbi:hypothetical protein HN935_02270 [archaeon]|jgi:hypothetical protein|nr:hypothetical protein [archaeon]